MKKRKKQILVGIFICFIATQVNAVNIAALVFDPKNWLASIDQLYATYDQIMTNVRQLEQMYESYKQAVEAVQGFKFDEIQWDGDFDFRNEIRGTISSVDRQLSNIRKLRDVFTQPSLSVNGQKFSIADLVGAGKPGQTADAFFHAHYDEANKRMELVKKAFTKGLSNEQYMAIASKYGYSPANFMMVRNAEAQLKSQIGRAIAATSEVGTKEWAKAQEMKYGPIFKEAMGENASPKQVEQAVLLHQQLINENINLLGTNLNDIGALIAKNIHLKERQAEAEKERRELIRESKKAQLGVSPLFRGGNSLGK